MRKTTSGKYLAALTLLLAAVALAPNGRTVLKPGWNMFSPQQDVEVGQQLSPDAERQLPMLNDSRVDNYVNNLGLRLAAQATGEKYPYHFKVVNDKAINAFALPGGPHGGRLLRPDRRRCPFLSELPRLRRRLPGGRAATQIISEVV